ncbi:MAG: AI-2E family transporter [Bacteroidales bacterium]|nr:AI-2E family transporter [Bacteroidales bacterium]
MENGVRYTEKLAKYILIATGAAIILGICWFFRDIITYILAAVVVSLIAKPLVKILKKVSIKGRHAPDWLLAVLSLILVLACFFTFAYVVVPIAGGIIKNISFGSLETALKTMSVPLADLNSFLIRTFPRLGEGFRLEVAIVQELQNLFNLSQFSSLIGSAASFFTNLAIGLFSVVFIGFFFIKDDGLFTEIVCALVPDRYEKTTEKAISDIGHLLSRYFIGVLVEILGVALINFLGLSLIARLGVNAALGIAVITGIFNVIPYVGPFVGIVTGTALGLIIKYSSLTSLGLDVSFWAFTAILIAILYFTQLVDNFVYQPLIYSTSIKAKPLEIFIVLLVVGYIGGPLAMIIAIPSYTVVRVIAFRFFGHVKAIKRLIPDEKLITSEKE